MTSFNTSQVFTIGKALLYSRLYVVFRISSLLLFVNNYPSKSIYLLSNMLYETTYLLCFCELFTFDSLVMNGNFLPKSSLSKRRSPLSQKNQSFINCQNLTQMVFALSKIIINIACSLLHFLMCFHFWKFNFQKGYFMQGFVKSNAMAS